MDQYFIKKLHLQNFRNIHQETVEFSSNINCIFGDNGNGKTNLLEAIYYLSFKKSFRKKISFQHIINIECENPEIIMSSLYETKENKQLTYSGKILSDSNEWYLNNKPSKKKNEVKSILINPFDSFQFHSSSTFRRTWIDQHFSILSADYKSELKKFTVALRFRNNLLSKKPDNYQLQINAIAPQIVEHTYNLIQLKKKILEELKNYSEGIFKEIFQEEHDLLLDLDSKFENMTKDQIQGFYENSLEKDLIVGHTTSGVHRDDYIFNFDGFNSYEYCSLGQQKMSFLSLIFAYIELFRYKFKAYPIVLIDDVSGELDQRRWKNLIGYLISRDFQVLITTANENFKKELEKIENTKRIFIQDGKIKIL